jgi:hypothetical protein
MQHARRAGLIAYGSDTEDEGEDEPLANPEAVEEAVHVPGRRRRDSTDDDSDDDDAQEGKGTGTHGQQARCVTAIRPRLLLPAMLVRW